MRAPVNSRKGRQPLRSKSSGGAPVYSSTNAPAPTGGWDAVHPLAAMPADRAVVLDNWFPEPGFVRVRRGYQEHCSGLGAGVVESLLVYNANTVASSKMFGCANSSIYDVSSSGTAAEEISGLSNNRWQSVNFSTSGGHFLWACNGQDSPRTYNGSAWSTPTITGTGIDGADAIFPCVHKSRLWWVIADSMDAAYLPVNSIQGAAVKFPLGAVMSKGGYLLSIGTWTHDGGNGPDDYLVFMSSRGQAAVYSGNDPSSSSDWSLVGVYEMGVPLGRRCLTKVSGDLAVLCVDGVLPFSTARGVDRGAAATVAITANINNAMNESARLYGDYFGWELTAYPRGTAAILNVPVSQGVTQYQYVMNTLTGAWCRFKGWNANCWVVFNDNLYFGGNDGAIYLADTGAQDGSDAINAIGQGAYSFFNNSALKQFKMVQPILTTDTDSNPAVGMSTDFKDNAALGTPTTASIASAKWDDAVWDSDIWPIEGRTFAEWTGVSGVGSCGSIHFHAQTQAEGEVIMRLNSFNVLYEKGAVL